MQERRLARLRWLCRRGMKELDLVVSHYLNKEYLRATPDARLAFESLLELSDPQLYDLILAREKADNENVNEILEALRNTLKVGP